jgi:hypothetical protein
MHARFGGLLDSSINPSGKRQWRWRLSAWGRGGGNYDDWDLAEQASFAEALAICKREVI